MVKQAMTHKDNKRHNLFAASATVAALVLPLSFATPAVAIERAEVNIHPQVEVKKTPKMPSQDAFNAAKSSYDKQLAQYQQDKQSYETVIKDNLPLPDYKDIVAQQDQKVDTLNAEIEPLMQKLNDINKAVVQINTQNAQELSDLLSAYKTKEQEAKTAQSNLEELQKQIDTKYAENKEKIDTLKAKALDAEKQLQVKQNEYDAFKGPYEVKAQDYEKQLSAYNEKLSVIQDEIDALKELIAQGDSVYTQASEDASSLQKKIDELQTTYDEVHSEYDALAKQYRELTDKYQALESSYTEAKEAVEAANSAVEQANIAIAQETAELKLSCNNAQETYTNAEQARIDIKAAYDKQVAASKEENEQNAEVYDELESKINELTQIVDEYNAKRGELHDQAKAAKDAVDEAYTTAKTAYDSALQLRQAAEKIGEEYNSDATAYNDEVQKEYQDKLDAYNEAQAKFQQELKDMEKANNEFGNLTKPAWQGLSFGKGDAKQLADGGVTWLFGGNNVIAEGNKLYYEIAPEKNAVVVYSGNAVKGFTFDGKQIASMNVTYYNYNNVTPTQSKAAVGPVWIGADADFRNGFTACYKIEDPARQTPMAPGSQFSLISNAPTARHFWNKYQYNGIDEVSLANLQAVGVKIQFVDQDGNFINFTDAVPAALYIPNLYREHAANDGVDYFKSVTFDNFDEIIPIKGATIEADQVIDGYAKSLNKMYPATSKILVNTEYTPNFDANGASWKDVNDPEYYKSCIFGVKNTGDNIFLTVSKFIIPTADTPEVANYPKAGELGFTQRFLANIPAVPLPQVPTVEKPQEPNLAPNLTIGLEELGDAPVIQDVEVPDVVKLAKPDAAPQLGVLDPKDVTPDETVKLSACPKPPVPFEGVGKIAALCENLIQAPVEPAGLPTVPQVKKPQTPQRHTLPKTADESLAGIAGIIIAFNFVLFAFKSRDRRNS